MKKFFSIVKYFFLGLIGLFLALSCLVLVLFIYGAINWWATAFFFDPTKKEYVACALRAKDAVPKGFAICKLKEFDDVNQPATMIVYDSSGQLETPHCKRSLSWQRKVHQFKYFEDYFTYQKLAKNYYKIFFDDGIEAETDGEDHLYSAEGASSMELDDRCAKKE